MQLYQVMQAVKVMSEASEFHGQAGCVVSLPSREKATYGVKLDIDGQIREFAETDIQGL